MFINILIEGKISVKASINITSKFNTISKSLFDKLEEDYGLECLSGDELIAKISLEYPPKTYTHRARIVIDDISILLIKENNNKANPTKNNTPRSDLSIDKITNMIKKILLDR
ncbi:3619_t:CDS:2, partial [Scutellospora calospora]